MRGFYLLISVLCLLLIASCNREPEVSVENLKRITEALGSDQFMGRKPFTEGERITIDYLQKELKNIGYEPGFGDSYLQKVPLLETKTSVTDDCVIKIGKQHIRLNTPDQIAIHAPYPQERIEIKDSKLVFCGFGIQAPEYGWDDFEGIDVNGKTIVVLINDPGLYSGNRDLFRGKELTYYGRWTYKFDKAAQMGAEGVIIIHEEVGAGYGYNVPRNNALSAHLYIDDESVWGRCKLAGWMSADTADEIFGKLGYSVHQLRTQYAKGGMKPFEMNATISVGFENSVERNFSNNVAGILKGASRPDEAVIISAHWDHFGIGEASNGDSIFNGAVDNGTVMAWAFEIGRMVAQQKKRPDRSVILFFPTAEEQGLVGSQFYTLHPIIPMSNTVACFNNDIMVPRGAMNDLTIIGFGHSELDSLFNIFAERQGRYILPDPNPEAGLFFRSDHYSFIKAGVASSWAFGCYDSKVHGKKWAEETYNEFVKNVYHTPHDNYDPNWDWSGVVQDIELTYDMIKYLTKGDSPIPKVYENR